jgi:hypothetical protein
MVDLAPEGCVSLRDFYDRFSSWRWNGHVPFDELNLEELLKSLPVERAQAHLAARSKVIDQALAEAVRIFQRGRLYAFVCPPDSGDRRSLSERAWNRAFFPERMFLADTIGAGHGPEFDAAFGRTPFVHDVFIADCFKDLEPSRLETPAPVAMRDLLIGLVMDGVIGSWDAEQYGKKWRLRPMEEKPDPKTFDPRRQVAWTLPMALAWIVWRRYDDVRDAMDDHRANSWVWFGFTRRLPINGGAEWFEVTGEKLKTLEPLSMMDMSLLEAIELQATPERLILSVKSACEDLWRRLAEGALTATGIDPSGKVVQIPPHEWPYIELRESAERGIAWRSGEVAAPRHTVRCR